MIDLEKARYEPVGFCIYCGATENLTKEHILPLALNSPANLPDASCRSCAEITGPFEQIVLRGPLWPVRVFRDFRSRTKHRDAPKTISFTVVRDGKKEDMELPLSQAPIISQFHHFPQPGQLRPSEYKGGIQVCGQSTVGFGTHPKEVLEELNATSLSISQEYKPVEFARMIAKIGYCVGFAEKSLSHVKESRPPVVRAILGETEDIGRYVGTSDTSTPSQAGLVHHVSLVKDGGHGLLIAKVHLFADSQAPVYDVILGTLETERKS